jgi:cytochrome c peroxidase
MNTKNLSYLFTIMILVSSCDFEEGRGRGGNNNVEDEISALPQTANHPTANSFSTEKVNLGRMLFWDPIMSGKKDIACVSCHHPDFGYADGIDLSLGVGGTGLGFNRTGGTLVKRNTPTIINTVFNGIDNDGNY